MPVSADGRIVTAEGPMRMPAGRKPIWVPQRGSQEMFLSCPLFEVLYEGTRGPGKTDCLLMDFAMDCGMGHGADWRGILFRQTYPQLQDVIAKTKKWFPQFFPEAKYNEAQHYWTWPDGERLLLRQYRKDDDYWSYHGHEYPWQGWEELCTWASPGGYKRMQSTCRSSNPKVAKLARLRATTNPYGPGHNWVKHRFKLPGNRFTPIVDSYDEDGRLEPPRVAIHGSLWENRILLDADPGYVDRIRSSARNQAELKAWLEGSWDIVAGGMFDDVWDVKQNVVKPFPIPPTWRLDRAFDWGSTKPFSVGWWAESDGSDYILPGTGQTRSTVRGDLFRVYEWYGWCGRPNEGLRMLAVDVAAGIIEREVKWGLRSVVRPGPADSAIFNVENGVSIAADMAKQVRLEDGRTFPGVRWLQADKRPGSRKAGWEMMRKMLKSAWLPPSGVREHPGLFVTEQCKQFISLVPVLPRDDKDLDDLDTDAEDHIADETRYRVRAVGQRARSGTTSGV